VSKGKTTAAPRKPALVTPKAGAPVIAPAKAAKNGRKTFELKAEGIQLKLVVHRS